MSRNNEKSRLHDDLSESPYDRAGLLSKYSLAYMLPLFKKAYRKEIGLEDIGGPPRADYSKTLGLRLQQAYNQELIGRKKPSFLKAMLKTFGPQLIMFSFIDFTSKCIIYPMQTIALGWLIRDAGIYLNFATMNQSTINQETTATPTTSNLTNIVMPVGPAAEALAQGLTSDEAYWKIITDAVILLLITMSALAISHPYFFQTYHMGMKCRVAACHLIYKKSLRLSQSAMSQTTVGQMVNLLSNDVNRFDQVPQMIPFLLMAPLQAITVMSILSLFYLGIYPTLASFVSILSYVIIQTSMGRGFSRYRAKTARRTDERVRLMNEIILAMRIIKMYAWEKPFKIRVNEARRREVTTIGIASILRTINQTLFFVSSKIIVFVALITYVLLGYSFNPEIVFVSIGLANLVRISLTLFFPNAIAYCAETVVTCRRINDFLMLPEIESATSNHYKSSPDSYGCKYVVAMNKVYASWASKEQEVATSPESRWAIIRDLSISIRSRDLVLIVGRVGSGKSSILMALLGELPIASGRLEINGRISYASQEAWIFSGSVRDNILFGKAYERRRYEEVVRVCSLERDLEILVEGDATIVGERGVSLSGGQRARVNLARALYHEADIYLLDDPLSAVDAPVARHIFNESLRTFLRKKTVILATHQLQFLRHATKVLVVDRDSPAAFGTLQEVMQSEAFAVVDYSKEAFEDATTTEAGTDAELRDDLSARTSRRTSRGSTAKTGSSVSSASQSPPKLQDNEDNEQQDSDRLIRAASQASSNLAESVKMITSLTDDEKANLEMDDAPVEQKMLKKKLKLRQQGTEVLSTISSNFRTYLYYISNASGILMFTWFILINIIAQGLYQMIDYFLSYWTDSVQRKEYQGAAFVPQTFVDQLSIGEISTIYASLTGLLFLATLFRASTFFIGTLRASINIHRRFFNCIIHAPMTFFDFSPIGILLNRLSRDIGFVDETLPATAIEIITIFVNISGILVLTILLDIKNLAATIVLLVMSFLLRTICANTITRLKQMEGISRSPVFSHLSTTLSGLPTIRSFKVQDDFIRYFDRFQDTHTSAWFNYISSNRWLAVSMDWLCFTFIVLVTTLLLAVSLDATNASLIGLLISQIIVLPGPFQWGMRQLIEVESQMTSVQRIKEFSEIKSESELMATRPDKAADGGSSGGDSGGSQDETLLASYQSGRLVAAADTAEEEEKGEIRFSKVSLAYFADEPAVLRELSFVVRAREKVGIVGRTGAGKSSLVAALFRLYDFEGRIELDGRDTKTLGLAELRRSMSIIPQEPVLFGGSIRRNLDPFGEHPDRELWAALEAVQLGALFAASPAGLGFGVSEAGANLSVGQRQLVCLARAVLRRPRILVLDEATASVDPETDGAIQRTIAQQFARCTVLTIAHRLLSVAEADRLLVLERGQLREFGPPLELLRRPDGLFSRMVRSSQLQAPRLVKLITEAHERRQAKDSSPAEG